MASCFQADSSSISPLPGIEFRKIGVNRVPSLEKAGRGIILVFCYLPFKERISRLKAWKGMAQ